MADGWDSHKQRDDNFKNLEGEQNVDPQPKHRLGRHMIGWIILFVLFIVGAGIFAAFGPFDGSATNAIRGYVNTNSSTVGDGNSANPSPSARLGNAAQTADVSQLLSHPKQFEDHPVVLSQAVVQQRLSNNVVTVGSADTHNPQGNGSVTVALPADATQKNFEQGTPVRITGTLTPVPPGELDLGLTSSQVQQVEQQGFYLRASAIYPVPGNDRTR